MISKQTHWLALGAIALVAAGCGGSDDDARARGKVVITPSAESQADPEPAGEQAEPEGESTAAAKAPAESTPPAEAKPEMKNEAVAETASDTASEPDTASEQAPSDETAVAEAKPAAEPEAKPEPEPAESAESKAAAAEEEVSTKKSDAEKGTTFKGRVVVKGTPPPVNPIIPSGNDPYCINLGEIKNDSIVIGEGGGLADVFVWVKKFPSGVDVPPPPEEPVVLDQKGCRFIPHALVVRAGQTLLLKNDDATLHNTKMGGFKNSFNSAVAANDREGEKQTIEYAEPIPLPVECNIHAWMSARVLATDNPWHAVTDQNGNFEINNLPSGVELEFCLQHGQAGYIEKSLELTLTDGEVKEQTFEVDAIDLSD